MEDKFEQTCTHTSAVTCDTCWCVHCAYVSHMRDRGCVCVCCCWCPPWCPFCVRGAAWSLGTLGSHSAPSPRERLRQLLPSHVGLTATSSPALRVRIPSLCSLPARPQLHLRQTAGCVNSDRLAPVQSARRPANLITSDQLVTHGARTRRNFVAEGAELCAQPLVLSRTLRSARRIIALRSATIIALFAQQVGSLRLDSHLESWENIVGVRVLCATHPVRADLI